MVLLHESLNNEEQRKFSRIFGNKSITADDVAWVRSLLEKYAVKDKVRSMMIDYAKTALGALEKATMSSIHINTQAIRVLIDFVEYSFDRSS